MVFCQRFGGCQHTEHCDAGWFRRVSGDRFFIGDDDSFRSWCEDCSQLHPMCAICFYVEEMTRCDCANVVDAMVKFCGRIHPNRHERDPWLSVWLKDQRRFVRAYRILFMPDLSSRAISARDSRWLNDHPGASLDDEMRGITIPSTIRCRMRARQIYENYPYGTVPGHKWAWTAPAVVDAVDRFGKFVRAWIPLSKYSEPDDKKLFCSSGRFAMLHYYTVRAFYAATETTPDPVGKSPIAMQDAASPPDADSPPSPIGGEPYGGGLPTVAVADDAPVKKKSKIPARPAPPNAERYRKAVDFMRHHLPQNHKLPSKNRIITHVGLKKTEVIFGSPSEPSLLRRIYDVAQKMITERNGNAQSFLDAVVFNDDGTIPETIFNVLVGIEERGLVGMTCNPQAMDQSFSSDEDENGDE